MSNIVYGRVSLRPWRVEDADTLIEIAKCEHVQLWLKDWQDVEEWARPWIEGQLCHHEINAPEQEFMSWAITVPPSDTPVGVINLGGDEMDHKGLSLGYFLHEDALHKGYATEAVQALCRHTFERWDFAEIYANARLENRPSRAVLERSGFAYQGDRLEQLPGYEAEVSCAWYVKKKPLMITLREITPENWLECIKLSVDESQKDFVAPNVYSLAQAKVYPSYRPLAIYHGDEMVGFTLYGVDPDDNEMGISRLMIDQRYQGRGYGRAAMVQLLDMIRRDASCHAVYLSFEPENKNAEALYTSLGFEHTGEVEGGELVMKLVL